MEIRSRLWRSKPDSFPSTLHHDPPTILYEHGQSQSSFGHRYPVCNTNRYHHFGVTIPFYPLLIA